MSVTPDWVDAGQSIYIKRTLNAYDFIVLGASNHLIWKCPTQRLVDHYNKHVTTNHLDVGVGKGFRLSPDSDEPQCRYFWLDSFTGGRVP
jgi:hypothetical protein